MDLFFKTAITQVIIYTWCTGSYQTSHTTYGPSSKYMNILLLLKEWWPKQADLWKKLVVLLGRMQIWWICHFKVSAKLVQIHVYRVNHISERECSAYRMSRYWGLYWWRKDHAYRLHFIFSSIIPGIIENSIAPTSEFYEQTHWVMFWTAFVHLKRMQSQWYLCFTED